MEAENTALKDQLALQQAARARAEKEESDDKALIRDTLNSSNIITDTISNL